MLKSVEIVKQCTYIKENFANIDLAIRNNPKSIKNNNTTFHYLSVN